MENIAETAIVWVIPVLLAITLHEAAHAFVARFLGDSTAYMQGRMTLNPFRHIDPLGTVVIPAMLFLVGSPFIFGYAKPVPVNFGAVASSQKRFRTGGPGGTRLESSDGFAVESVQSRFVAGAWSERVSSSDGRCRCHDQSGPFRFQSFPIATAGWRTHNDKSVAGEYGVQVCPDRAVRLFHRAGTGLSRADELLDASGDVSGALDRQPVSLSIVIFFVFVIHYVS